MLNLQMTIGQINIIPKGSVDSVSYTTGSYMLL